MSDSWICCNSCFQSPSADRKIALAVTTCGHIICNVCFQKGKQGECFICKAKCQVSPISDKSSPEVKTMFADINTVATKYFTEISKVLQFQAGHQRRLLNYYRERSEKLEEAFGKKRQDMQQMSKQLSEQEVKLREQKAYIAQLESSLQHHNTNVAAASAQMSHRPHRLPLGPKSATQIQYNSPMPLSRHASTTELTNVAAASAQMSHRPHRLPLGPKSATQIQYNSPMPLSRHASTTELVESMDQEEQGLFRKPEMVRRVSLISPPMGGRMGTIPHRSSDQSTLVECSPRSVTVSRFQKVPLTPDIARSSGWQPLAFKPSTFRMHTSMSPSRPR